jgi:glutamate-1-semialdehyde 2,1-aminomutase
VATRQSAPSTRLQELLRRERSRLERDTPTSRQLFERARTHLAGGVVSSFQARSPYPIYLAGGHGAHIQDVDGRRLIDFHMGFGAMVVGHAHERIGEVLREHAARATHLGAPTADALPVVEELQRRFGLPGWRFCNSGTEATMAAIRLARAATGRQLIVKIAGAYNGHHDAVMVPAARGQAAPDRLVAMGLAAQPPTLQVPFGDADGLEDVLQAQPGEIACLIVEVPMLAPYPCLPTPGYLDAVRALTREHGVLLVLDEVKTGATIAAGGATERFALEPDIVALAKAIGGGLPTGAIGAREDLMRRVAEGEPPIYGTFNGNPLSMAAAQVTLTEVLNPSAYRALTHLGVYLAAQARAAVAETGLPVTVVDCGPKGGLCVTSTPPADVWEWEHERDPLLTELLWLHQLNRGVYMSPAPRMHWSLSVAHEEADIDRFAANLRELGRELA